MNKQMLRQLTSEEQENISLIIRISEKFQGNEQVAHLLWIKIKNKVFMISLMIVTDHVKHDFLFTASYHQICF